MDIYDEFDDSLIHTEETPRNNYGDLEYEVARPSKILCAANYYDDGKKHPHTPKNVETGFVICGRRHHNCIAIFAQMMGFEEEQKYSKDAMTVKLTEVQGFLTSDNRFVSRKEAYTIAYANDQIVGPNKGYASNEIGLTSEDLY